MFSIFILWLVVLLWPAPEAAQATKPRFPTAGEVSRQFLPVHPKPRNEAERRILAVFVDASRWGMYITRKMR
jgi:hypothetical protein